MPYSPALSTLIRQVLAAKHISCFDGDMNHRPFKIVATRRGMDEIVADLRRDWQLLEME